MGRKKEIPGKHQLGFYLDSDGDELHLRPQSGDKMIRPEVATKGKKALNPYDEVMAYLHAMEDWEAGVGEVRADNDNGGVTIFDVDRHGLLVSRIGEDGDPHYVEADVATKPLFEALSPKAKGLYWALRNQEKK